jgi:hypothetical protein
LEPPWWIEDGMSHHQGGPEVALMGEVPYSTRNAPSRWKNDVFLNAYK